MMRAQVNHCELGETGAMRGRGLVAAVWMAAGLAVLGVAGCGPDPAGKFDEFVEQTKESASGGATSGPGSSSTGEPTGGSGSTGGPAAYDINGDFLLAVSTTVDRGKPLQFIATNTVTEADGKQTLATCLQPLTLTQGKVLVPRVPIGDPLCFAGLEIVDGAFTIDAGIVMVTGEANPITGANIVASLVMAGTIQSDDLYCGTVTGEVMEPPVGDITGSSFAAVRLTDTAVLPNPVIIDCKGTSVTDK